MSKTSRAERLYIDQIQQLTAQTPLGASVSIVNSIVLSLVLWSVISRVRIIIWFSFILGISLIRIILQKKYKEKISDLKTAINGKNHFLICTDHLFISLVKKVSLSIIAVLKIGSDSQNSTGHISLLGCNPQVISIRIPVTQEEFLLHRRNSYFTGK